jgi:hypothetical protein
MLIDVQKKKDFLRTLEIHQSLSCIYFHFEKKKIFHLYLAGSYAQLTLLGQTKIQKSISNDSQNGRVQFRTQSSNPPERSNSTHSTNSLQTVSDIKKARDQYEKILKQLDVFI